MYEPQSRPLAIPIGYTRRLSGTPSIQQGITASWGKMWSTPNDPHWPLVQAIALPTLEVPKICQAESFLVAWTARRDKR